MVLGKDIIILAIKPQMMRKVVSEIKEVVTEKQLIISIAAATSTQFIGMLGKEYSSNQGYAQYPSFN